MKQHAMRRQDRAMAEADCLRLLAAERVGRLAMSDQQGQPYLVPLNHVLLGETIFFHSAKVGQKLEILQENPRVCYEVDRMLGIQSGPSACEYGAFFESAIAFGTAYFVSDAAEKVRILNQLTAHHAAADAEFAPVTEKSAERVVVVGIRIDRLTGKARHK